MFSRTLIFPVYSTVTIKRDKDFFKSLIFMDKSNFLQISLTKNKINMDLWCITDMINPVHNLAINWLIKIDRSGVKGLIFYFSGL